MTNWPDIINALFELLGGFVIILSIRQIVADKQVKGVSWPHVGFFSLWGLWNLYFYPWAGAWFSFAGGMVIVVTNTIWLMLLIKYSRSKA